MKYSESKRTELLKRASKQKTPGNLYLFKIYAKGSSFYDDDYGWQLNLPPYLTDFYTADDAKEMWKMLIASGESFNCFKANLENDDLEDITLEILLGGLKLL